MEDFRLRDAAVADAAALSALGRSSFDAAFGHLYRPEDLAGFLDTAHDPAAVAAEIADPAFIHRLAVDADDILLGYCKLNAVSAYAAYSDAAAPIGLSQLYTDPALTGKGLGAALMDWALDTARGRGADAVQLSVWSENFGAQKFYQRNGFTKIADIDFWVGSHRDDEFLYELRL